jgi:hypothetical protein
VVVVAEDGENDQGARAVGQKPQHGFAELGDDYGFLELGQVLEGAAQKDQSQNLDLLANGFGHRAGQGEDEADHLHDQDQGEGHVHRQKVACS